MKKMMLTLFITLSVLATQIAAFKMQTPQEITQQVKQSLLKRGYSPEMIDEETLNRVRQGFSW